MEKQRKGNGINALQTLALGFAVVILVGACLLTLPIAAADGVRLSFFDALFTATSACCVTGLVVADTATAFSLFGQVVILVLIQIGGLGVITVLGFVMLLFRRRIQLRSRTLLMEQLSSPQLGGVVRLVKRIFVCTAVLEGVGAALLCIRFVPLFGWAKGVFYGVFHAVSAFCNAGFDLFGVYAPYGSLVPFADDALVNAVVMGLIVTGGLGFIVWDDILDHRLHISKYRLQTKIVLVSTAALVVGGAALFALAEWDNTLLPLSGKGKVLAALFQSVSPRTAGFNTVDIAALSDAGKGLTVLLMAVGAGAGSTAGGLKITTCATLALSAWYFMRGREDVNAFGRRIDVLTVRRALSTAVLYLTVVSVGLFVLLLQGVAFSDAVLEAFSAMGTVGLSTGVTRELLPLSRAAVILMMYVGRLGSLSVMMAMAERRAAGVTLPPEKIMVG